MILSVIIPTKNRYTTLFRVVRSILNYNLNNSLEIVIQDNSDDNSAAIAFMKENKRYSNLKYYHSFEKLSVIENSNKAVLNASGDYICFIGDDDIILPNIIKIISWMQSENIEVLKCSKPQYHWPGQQSSYIDSDVSGILKIKKFGNLSTLIKTKDSLEYTNKVGGTNMDMLPCLYHGIVKRSVLDLIYNKTKNYFPGPSPDMANAIALCQVVDNFVFLDCPFVISGKSSSSTGGQGILHKHVARIEDVKHLPKETSGEWTSKIPKYWTGPTIWAESVLKSYSLMGNVDFSNNFNFEYLYAYLLVFNKSDKDVIFSNFSYSYKNLRIYYYIVVLFLYRVKVFVKNRNYLSVKKVSDLSEIAHAVDYINNNFRSRFS